MEIESACPLQCGGGGASGGIYAVAAEAAAVVSSPSSGQHNGGPGDIHLQGQGPGRARGPRQEQERGPRPGSRQHVPGGRAQEGRVIRHGRQVLLQPGELNPDS